MMGRGMIPALSGFPADVADPSTEVHGVNLAPVFRLLIRDRGSPRLDLCEGFIKDADDVSLIAIEDTMNGP